MGEGFGGPNPANPGRADASEGRLRVRLAADSDRKRWDGFVARCADATFFHQFGWRGVVETGLGHRTWFLLAERGEAIEGVLPLAEVRSILFGHRLISVPGSVYGGIAAATEGVRKRLTEEACRLAGRLGVEVLELRNRAVQEPTWPRSDLYATFRKEISGDVGANWKAIPRKQRAMIRKGMDAGLKVRQVDGVDAFFPIYATSVRNLGTPVFAKKFFRTLFGEFRAAGEVSVVSHGSRDVAAVMSFYFRDEVLPYYAGSVGPARALRANDFMYWDLMSRAAERGVRVFDYGRSKQGTGAFDFKKNWGFSPQPLAYEFFLVKAKNVPAINPTNPKYRWLIDAWKRLPLPLANALGPFLARNLG
jgi:FemAB-related protein (PEP-CTERM system-associated)